MKQLKYLALATLVAFAACDEGTDVVVTPPVTGDIVGTVTIEGAAVSNVTVTLSTGESVTPVNGAYSFTGVAAGAYTVTIAGFDANATFSSTSKAVTITANAQVATVNFAGSWVRTSAVLGSVAAGGAGLTGVNVSIGSSSTITDANGQYSFSGLRAGTYTVTLSGFNAQQYAFATSTQNVTVGVGESKVVSFAGQLLATSTISGTLFIDGNDNDDMDAGEPAIAKAGITVALETAVGDSIYTTTDANGMYSFPDLAEGTYKVVVDGTQSAVPGAFVQSGDMRYLAVATSGAATTVNFPFVVATQYVTVYGMLGRDGKNVGVAPIKSWTMTLYPTEVDATASTNKLNASTVKTDANGMAKFVFEREDDYSPNAKVADGIVFAKVAAPGASYAVSGETIIEIPWLPTDSMVMAPDTFDAVFNALIIKVHTQEIDQDTLAGWKVQIRAGKDSTAAAVGQNSNADGDVFINMAGVPANYPDTVWMRLTTTQAGANGHGFTQMPTANEAEAKGSYLRVIWDGTVASADTVDAGVLSVQYTDSDVKFTVHRELDDTMGFTAGDNQVIGGAGVQIDLRRKTSSGSTLVGSMTALSGAANASKTFLNVDLSKNYFVRARSLTANFDLLNDTIMDLTTLDGSDQIASIGPLKGSAGSSTFMVKTNNNTLSGKVASRYGATPIKGLEVTIAPTAMNIQGSSDTTLTTNASGNYSLAGMREGPYTITVSAGDSAYVFLRTLKTTFSPAGSTIRSSLTDDNDSPTQGTRDLEGSAVTLKANFEGYRSDTKFSGLVVNDRDLDLSTVDPGEALQGAVINLYRDDDGSATANTADTLIGQATTDAGGAYTFTGLLEGRYTAVWAANTPSTDVIVTRGLTVAASSTTKVSATPLMAANTKHTSASLPRWNYNNSAIVNGADADFTFLYSTTVVKGTIKAAAAVGTFAIGDPVPGMQVSLQRCHDATTTNLTAFSGPKPFIAAVDVCTAFFNGTSSAITDANGVFQFQNLTEGIYQATILPNTVSPFVQWNDGFGNPNNPILFWTSGSGDIEANNLITVQ
jgi:hypothetical protein